MLFLPFSFLPLHKEGPICYLLLLLHHRMEFSKISQNFYLFFHFCTSYFRFWSIQNLGFHKAIYGHGDILHNWMELMKLQKIFDAFYHCIPYYFRFWTKSTWRSLGSYYQMWEWEYQFRQHCSQFLYYLKHFFGRIMVSLHHWLIGSH